MNERIYTAYKMAKPVAKSLVIRLLSNSDSLPSKLNSINQLPYYPILCTN